jgi:hypothetical protein
MVLAIVVAAVEAVQRTSVDGATFDTTWHVLKRHVLMLGSFYSGGRIMPETLRWGGAAVHAAAAGTHVPLPYKLRYQKWKQDYATRYAATVNAKKWVATGEKSVEYQQLNQVLNSVPLATRHELYAAAATVFRTRVALSATRSRTADETELASRTIDKNLLVLERRLDIAPATAAADGAARGGDDRGGGGVGAEEDEEQDPDVVFEKLMKRAVRTRAGVAEMLILSKAAGAILNDGNKKV